MTWLYVPGIFCRSATATAAPSSPSDPWRGYEPWLVLSGTVTQRPSSWNGWNRRGWIHALSGMTSPPSTVDRGVDEWISSLPASPAPTSRQLGDGPELTVSTGSGPSASRSSARWDRGSCCWKTSPDLFGSEDLPESSVTLPTTGSMRNGVCSQRPPLALLTNASAGGSWPTATASDHQGNGMRSGDRSSEAKLAGAARQWPTPVAGDAKQNRNSQDALDRGFDGTMTDAVRQWGTPTARDEQRTPAAAAAAKARMVGGPRTEITSLTVQSKMWATPMARDHKGSSGPASDYVSLPKQVGHLAVTTSPDGVDGSPRADLNPFFVAALMGLPWDWLTHFTSEVTASCRNALRTPGDNCSSAAGG